jgi:hypothetical protein
MERSVTPRILNPGTRWRTVVSFTPLLFYHRRQNQPHPLCRRLGRPKFLSVRQGEEIKSFPCQESNSDSSVQTVARHTVETVFSERPVVFMTQGYKKRILKKFLVLMFDKFFLIFSILIFHHKFRGR